MASGRVPNTVITLIIIKKPPYKTTDSTHYCLWVESVVDLRNMPMRFAE